jgi:hypothetical protein
MLQDDNPGGHDTWTRVAATIRQIQANAQQAYPRFPKPTSGGAAVAIVKRYRDDAQLEAAFRADQLLEDGDDVQAGCACNAQ